jgi:hypothetical protein
VRRSRTRSTESVAEPRSVAVPASNISSNANEQKGDGGSLPLLLGVAVGVVGCAAAGLLVFRRLRG